MESSGVLPGIGYFDTAEFEIARVAGRNGCATGFTDRRNHSIRLRYRPASARPARGNGGVRRRGVFVECQYPVPKFLSEDFLYSGGQQQLSLSRREQLHST